MFVEKNEENNGYRRARLNKSIMNIIIERHLHFVLRRGQQCVRERFALIVAITVRNRFVVSRRTKVSYENEFDQVPFWPHHSTKRVFLHSNIIERGSVLGLQIVFD